MRPTIAAAALAWSTLLPATASANDQFPAKLQQELSMPCQPACTICHRDLAGGFATINKPLGRTWQIDYGLDPGELDSVEDAVAQATAFGSDVDQDGQTDVEELSAGIDPNTPGDQTICVATPDYGCGATVAPRPGRPARHEGLLALVCAGIVAVACRRRG